MKSEGINMVSQGVFVTAESIETGRCFLFDGGLRMKLVTQTPGMVYSVGLDGNGASYTSEIANGTMVVKYEAKAVPA